MTTHLYELTDAYKRFHDTEELADKEELKQWKQPH